MKNQYPKRSPPPTRIDLDPAEFNAAISDFGTIFKVTPTVICPRRSGTEIERADVNHDLNCPLCFGRILIDLDERSFQAEAYMQAIKLDRVFDQGSRFDVKDALVTFKSTDRVSYWYKLELIDFQSLFNETIMRRKDSDFDRLRYNGLEPDDGTYYALVDSEGKRYYREGDDGPSSDYRIEEGKLIWTSSCRPDEAKLYSLIYPITPTFRVLELLHETRHYYNGFRKPTKEPVQLPQQAHVRWDYLFNRGSDVRIENRS